MRKTIENEYDSDSPSFFVKGIHIHVDGSVMLNNRVVAKNIDEFKNVETYKELDFLTIQEKNKFVESFRILVANNILSAIEQEDCGKKVFVFDYKEDPIYYGWRYERYLYLKEDIKDIRNLNCFLSYLTLLDENEGLILYKQQERE